jgi:hypothetical protein
MEAYDGLSFAREALNRVYKASGRQTSPGRTCNDIKEANPDFKNGMYWVDPNEGSALDAIQVYCNFDDEQTCIHPTAAEFQGQRWTKDTRGGQYFMEDVNNGKEFAYKTESQQLKFLQLLSTSATQTITYKCLNSSPYGTRFTNMMGEEMDSGLMRHKRTTFIDVNDNCTKDNQWHASVFTVRTKRTEVLPIVDMMLFDIGQENQQFGVEVGMVCFS